MDVRLARPTDAPLALALALDDSAHLVKRYAWPARSRIVRTLARSALPVALPGRLWIAQDGANSALLEAIPRRYVIGWDVIHLAVHGEPDVLLPSLLQAVTEHLRPRGVPRLFARCRAEHAPILQAAGFHPLAREYLLAGPGRERPVGTSLPEDSRYRMPQDAWPLHQLESETTPALVRQIEGLTSLEWSHRLKDMDEIVVERDGKVVAWAGWGAKSAPHARQIGLLVDPNNRSLGPELIAHALEHAPQQRFVARVRDYQTDVLDSFEECGFTMSGEEILLVKHARVEVAPVRRLLHAVQVPSVQIIHHRWTGRTPVHPARGLGL